MVPWLFNTALILAFQAPVLLAVGLHFDVLRRHNFLIGAVYALVALTIVSGLARYGPAVAIGAGFVSACLALGFAEILIYGPLERAGRSADEILIATLGANLVLEQILSLLFGDRIQFPHPTAEQDIVAGLMALPPTATALPLGIVSIIALALILAKSETGARLTALGENQILFRSLGFTPAIWRGATLVMVAATLTIGAVAAANLTGASPTAGFSLVILGFVTRLLGGPVHRLRFYIVSALVVTADQAAAVALPGEWRTLALYAVLLILISVRARTAMAVD